jgi:putative copper export protein
MVNPLHRLPMERNELMLLLALALFFGVHALARWLEPKIQRPWVRQWGQGIAYALFFYLVLTLETEPQEFIYFQF